MESFGNASGLKLNKHKTEGLWLGKIGNRNDKFENINWSKTCNKAQGSFMHMTLKKLKKKKWKDTLNSIKKILHTWNQRDLSLQGRILVIKT